MLMTNGPGHYKSHIYKRNYLKVRLKTLKQNIKNKLKMQYKRVDMI